MMFCDECHWMWEWSDDPTPHCPYCGKVGGTGPNAPPEAEVAVAQASGSVFEGGHAGAL